MSTARVDIVEGPDLDPDGERVALSVDAFALLDLPVPADFGEPGSRRQILVDAGDGVVAYTVAAAAGSGESVRMGPAALDRLRLAELPRSPVEVSTDILGSCELLETTVLRSCANVAVVAPHGGFIEDETDTQAELVASDPRIRADSWICRAPAGGAFRRWHITSDDLSEASFGGLRALLGARHDYAVSFHGFGAVDNVDLIVGGRLDKEIRRTVRDELERRLVAVLGRPVSVLLATSRDDPHPGLLPDNVVNRLASQGGLQIEQASVLRKSPEATQTVAEVVLEELAALAPPPRPVAPSGHP